MRCQLALFGILFLLVGCQENSTVPQQPKPNTVRLVLENQQAGKEEQPDAISLSQSTQPTNPNGISRHLETTYARMSANQKDICPKLVDFQQNKQSVVRHGEKLNQYNYCEYFVFLNQGDSLSVSTTNGIQADLVSPDWFNFSNGTFTAKKFDRYTIRLTYDGTRYRPTDLVYDVHIHKNIDNP